MEHRCIERKKVLLDVAISNRSGQVRHGSAIDISGEGKLIRTISPDIRKGEIVDITLPSGCCLRGWVVHAGGKGAGILFVSSGGEMAARQTLSLPLPKLCLRCLERHSKT